MYKIDKSPPKDILSVIPKDEEILWNGRPDLRRFCLSALGLRYIAVYLIVITGVIFFNNFGNFSLAVFLEKMFPYILSCFIAVILLVVIGASQVMPTVYVITSKRIIIKSGLALIFMLNVPFDKISNIDKQVLKDGCGNISFKLISNKRVPFFASWPSVRPWHFNNPEPTFRCIADVDVVAFKLAKAAQSRISEVSKSDKESERLEVDEKEMTA